MLEPLPETHWSRIKPSGLTHSKARELVEFLQRIKPPYVKLLTCKKSESLKREVIILKIEVELGQKQKFDIRQSEPIGIIFDPEDKAPPDVLALREDFPNTPHQNFRPFERPRSLCLDEAPYPEQRMRWSALAFVERIREWLRLMARGELHQEEQPLEPLLGGVQQTIILPGNFWERTDKNSTAVIELDLLSPEGEPFVLRARLKPDAIQAAMPRFIATVVETGPIEHGIISSQPSNLYELHEFFKRANYHLISEMRKRLRSWIFEKQPGNVDNARLVLLAVFPKQRTSDSAPEHREVWAFGFLSTIKRMGVALGVADQKQIAGHAGYIIEVGNSSEDQFFTGAKTISLFPMRPVYTLTPPTAAAFNNFNAPISKNLVAVGMGALGSQVFSNMLRGGAERWILVDHDTLLPHNCARHSLGGNSVGLNKAIALAEFGNTTIDLNPMIRPICVNLFDPGSKATELSEAFANADVVLDFSASVAVARQLALNTVSRGRRASIFLNPTGTDLVILIEDAERKSSLMSLEMDYYFRIASEKALSGHLEGREGRLRYSRSCGDITAKISQNMVALHAAIASQCLRLSIDNPLASIVIYRADPVTLAVRRCEFAPIPFKIQSVSGWTLNVSTAMLKKLHAMRRERLPSETGGVLIGYFDRERKIIYIVEALGSPEDSVEWPSLYIRGVKKVRQKIEQIEKATMTHLGYVGEWHSHPTGCSAEPSKTDKRAVALLAKEMKTVQLPGVMLIVAERKRHAFVID